MKWVQEEGVTRHLCNIDLQQGWQLMSLCMVKLKCPVTISGICVSTNGQSNSGRSTSFAESLAGPTRDSGPHGGTQGSKSMTTSWDTERSELLERSRCEAVASSTSGCVLFGPFLLSRRIHKVEIPEHFLLPRITNIILSLLVKINYYKHDAALLCHPPPLRGSRPLSRR